MYFDTQLNWQPFKTNHNILCKKFVFLSYCSVCIVVYVENLKNFPCCSHKIKSYSKRRHAASTRVTPVVHVFRISVYIFVGFYFYIGVAISFRYVINYLLPNSKTNDVKKRTDSTSRSNTI